MKCTAGASSRPFARRSGGVESSSFCTGCSDSHRTRAIIQAAFIRFSFLPRWHYDVLRALDYFQAVNAPRDERLSDAIHLVRDKQRKHGRWPLENRHKGKTWFELERPSTPSRWNTMRAMRVLKWWEGNQTAKGWAGKEM